MQIESSKSGTSLIIKVIGQMDVLTAPDFQKVCDEFIAKGEKQLIVDMEKLEYISSAGLRNILSTGKRLKMEGGSISLSGPNEMISKILDISGFSSLFPIYDSIDAAVEHA